MNVIEDFILSLNYYISKKPIKFEKIGLPTRKQINKEFVEYKLIRGIIRYSELLTKDKRYCPFDYPTWILQIILRCWPNEYKTKEIPAPFKVISKVDEINAKLIRTKKEKTQQFDSNLIDFIAHALEKEFELVLSDLYNVSGITKKKFGLTGSKHSSDGVDFKKLCKDITSENPDALKKMYDQAEIDIFTDEISRNSDYKKICNSVSGDYLLDIYSQEERSIAMYNFTGINWTERIYPLNQLEDYRYDGNDKLGIRFIKKNDTTGSFSIPLIYKELYGSKIIIHDDSVYWMLYLCIEFKLNGYNDQWSGIEILSVLIPGSIDSFGNAENNKFIEFKGALEIMTFLLFGNPDWGSTLSYRQYRSMFLQLRSEVRTNPTEPVDLKKIINNTKKDVPRTPFDDIDIIEKI
ncbi:MAG: hypothetical protein ACM3SY_03285 [Candidatus Omnitrophota bacterium]